MNNIDKQEPSEAFQEAVILLKQQKSLPMPEISPFYEKYMETMELKRLENMENLRINKANLQQQGIESVQQSLNSPNIDLKIISKSINQEVVILKATWGFFSTTITVLNIKQSNLKHGDQIQKGKFGCIYKRFHRQQQFVIKCIPLTQQSTRNKAIKEWFIMKIASAAQFGPKLTAYYGFDILMFQTCAEFCMELCKPIQSENFKEKEVYQNLTLMHALHFVHLDIKPKNIMFSPSWKKIVFIDFGLSNVINEQIGFKSLTNFVGSLSYCSQQMKKCFIEDRLMHVDLYYNDLCCLNKSTVQIAQFIEKKQFQQESFHLNQDQAEYYDLYFLKFNLYTLKIDECLDYWNKYVSTDRKKYFKVQLLQFLLELPPCQKLKHFFFCIVDESLTETSVYSKIKLIYQTAQQRLCSIDLLKDDQKQSIFKNHCSQFAETDKFLQFSKTPNQKTLTLAQFMMNPKEIQLIPFKGYVPLYLEYMSYIDNKNKITSVEREKAAIIYYQLFISSEKPSNLKGRQLLVNTLKHILEFLLNSTQFEEDRDNFALIVFRMFDFVIILCSESSSELVNLMSSLYHHHLLTEVYKTLFLLRISQSSFFMAFRIFSQAQEPRLIVLQKIFQWARAERDKLCLSNMKYQIMKNYRQSQSKQKASFISQQFMNEFATEIIQYQIIKEKMREKKSTCKYISYIELFNKLNTPQKPIKLFYFLLQLFDYYLGYQSSSAICKKVYQIVKSNFGDPSLLEEYIFSVQFETLFLVKSPQSRHIKLQILSRLSSEMKKVHEKDFILFSHFFLDDILKIIFFQSGERLQQQEKLQFMQQLIQKLLSFFQQEIFDSSNQNHTFHITLADLNKFFILCALEKIKKVDQFRQKICNSSKLAQIQCLNCRNSVSFYSKVLSLQNHFHLYHLAKNSGKQNLNKIISQYLQQTRHLEGELTKLNQQIKNFRAYISIVLDLKLQFCKSDSFLEQKCHGIQEYFLFSLKYNNFSGYFHSNYQKSSAIFSTILFLFYKKYDYFLLFLVKLVQYFEVDLIHMNYLTITTYFSAFLRRDKKLADKIFFDLLNYCKVDINQTPYIIILYAILFSVSELKSTQKKIVKEILLVASKLHIHFQREIQIILLSKILQIIKESEENKKQRRYFVYCNNRLLKILMIEGKTKPISVVSGHSNDPKVVMNSKISKLQKMSSKRLYVKLKRIRKKSLLN